MKRSLKSIFSTNRIKKSSDKFSSVTFAARLISEPLCDSVIIIDRRRRIIPGIFGFILFYSPKNKTFFAVFVNFYRRDVIMLHRQAFITVKF